MQGTDRFDGVGDNFPTGTDPETGEAETVEAGVVEQPQAEAAPKAVEEGPARAPLDKPYSARGFHVVDGQGRTIALCGYDNRFADTGPALAVTIADALNRARR